MTLAANCLVLQGLAVGLGDHVEYLLGRILWREDATASGRKVPSSKKAPPEGKLNMAKSISSASRAEICSPVSG